MLPDLLRSTGKEDIRGGEHDLIFEMFLMQNKPSLIDSVRFQHGHGLSCIYKSMNQSKFAYIAHREVLTERDREGAEEDV